MTKTGDSKMKTATKNMILTAAAFALVAFNASALTLETWDSGDTAGWGLSSSEATLSNPGGYLNVRFGQQDAPRCASDIAMLTVDPDGTPTAVSFNFCAFDVVPSSVRVYFHSSVSGNRWYLPLQLTQASEWVSYNIPLTFDAGWGMGPISSEQQFLSDIQSIDWAGVYVRRHGDVAAQDYGIDDFQLESQQAPVDTDGDGIPDSWEDDNGLNSADGDDASQDADRDGMNNYAEYRAGTNPQDAGSLLVVSLAATGSEVVGETLKWSSVEDRTYAVLRCTDLRQGFVKIATGISATPPQNTFQDEEAEQLAMCFYKIEVE